MKHTLVVALALAPTIVLAAGGGHGGEHGIPWGMIFQQGFNLALAIFIIAYFAGGKIKSHFVSRREDFTQLLRKAEEAKAAAEKEKKEISERLTKLTSNQDQSLANANSEAEELKKKILNDALTLSQKLEQEAHKSAIFELERAKLNLRKELLEASMKSSKTSLPKMVDSEKATALNQKFIDNLQVSQ